VQRLSLIFITFILSVEIGYQSALFATELTDHLARAEQALKAGNLREAGSEISIALKEDPTSGEAYNALGQICIARRDLWGAEECFMKATELSPKLADAYDSLATMELLRGKARKASVAARRLLDLRPNSYNAHFVLGTIAYEEGQYSQSRDFLGPLIDLPDGNDPLALALGIEDCKRLGRDEEVSQLLRRLDSLSVSRNDALLAAQIFRAPELQNYVLSWLQKIRTTPADSFEILCALGDTYVKTGQAKMAYQSYLEALSRKPSDVIAILKLSSVCEKLGERQVSLQYFNQAKTAPKQDVDSVITYSLACMRRHLFSEAHDALEETLKLGAQGQYLHYLLAATFYELSNYQRAEEELRKLLIARPNNVDALLLLGAVLMNRDRSDEAQEQFRLAVKLDPSRADGHYYLAQVYHRRGNHSGYEAELTAAIKLNPKDARPYADMAGLDVSEGHLDLARVHLEEALRLDPKSARAHYHRGQLLQKTGQWEEAKHEFELARELRVREEENAVTFLVLKETEDGQQGIQLEH